MADMTKAKEKLGYKPKVSIHDGLREEYEWIKKLKAESSELKADRKGD